MLKTAVNSLLLAWLIIGFSANAQVLAGLNHGTASGCSGAGCVSFAVSGPSTGVVGITSTAFTVTLSTGSFSGTQTITIADGGQGGTITPSVGVPGTSSVVVTPAAAATSFSFTYNPASTGTKILTFTNAQGWTNASPAGYIATRTFTATGPSTGTAGTASTNFTVTIGSGSFSGTDTVTISDGGQGGTITPSLGSPAASSVTVTPAAAATSFTFTYNAAVGAPVTLTFTNAQGWINPVTLPYTGAVTYTATGPSTGIAGTPSTIFTVAMPVGVHFTGAQTVTIADASAGGTFAPSVGSTGVSTVTVTPAAAATSFTFTYNAASNGAKTLTFSNAQSWTNPSPLTYTASPGAYTGPGDLVSGAKVWYGLRAYNSVYAAGTGNIAIFRRSSDNATCTGISNASGALDLTATPCSGTTNLPTFCGTSGGNCFVATLYDQSGALACGGAACNAVQATAGQQPQLIFNCVGSLPCMQGSSAANTFVKPAASFTLGAPYTLSAAAKTVASPPTQHNAMMANVGSNLFEFNVVGGNMALDYNDGGGPFLNGIVFATWYGVALTAATGSTVLYANSLTPDTMAVTVTGSSTWNLGLMSRTDCCALSGNMVEAGAWPVSMTPTQTTNLISNQRSYWGF